MRFEKLITVLAISALYVKTNAQNIGVNATGATPHPASILDLNTGNTFTTGAGKGFYPPNLALTGRNDILTVPNPTTSLLVYNTAVANTGTAAVSPGYYYWDGTIWVAFIGPFANSQDWTILGNAGTNSTTNFLGTTDAQDLVFKTNNTEAVRISVSGNVGIGTGSSTPNNKLEITQGTLGNSGLRFTNLPNASVLKTDANGDVVPATAATASNNGVFWGILGNAGTVDGTNFIGTTDNVPFNIRVNNQKAGRIDHLLRNTSLGYQSLNANTTGSNNIGIGYQSIFLNINASNNIAMGNQALYSNTTGSNNLVIGHSAMFANTSGYNNSAIGNQALGSNSTGYNNTAVGQLALFNNTTGNDNTAIGRNTMFFNTTGSLNTAIGVGALIANTSGIENIAIGHNALINNTTGNDNVAIGNKSLLNSISTSSSTAVGFQSLFSNTIGTANTAFGANSLYQNTIGANNTANGVAALFSNTTGSYNVAVGNSALYSNTTGSLNVAIGRSVLDLSNSVSNIAIGNGVLRGSNITGQFNTGIGDNILNQITSGNNNFGLGRDLLLSNTSGANNFALGTSNLVNNTTGNFNVAIGSINLPNNTTGGNNFAMGYNCMSLNTTGGANIAMGSETLRDANGSSNVALGTWALRTTQGLSNDNIAIGFRAGDNFTSTATISNNVLIGNTSGVNILGSNNIALGANTSFANTTNNNQLNIGNCIYGTGFTGNGAGNVGIGTTTPAFKFEVNGTTACTGNIWTSDKRKKQNILSLNINAIQIINKLKPVTYNWKEVKDDGMKGLQMGFIAQELEEVLPNMVVTADNEEKSKAVKYIELLPVLVKAIQELNAKVESLEKKIETLEKK